MLRTWLVAPVLLLTAAVSSAAPPFLYSPRYVNPPSYYHYPSSSNYNVPYYRSPSNYFAPPVSYYDRPYSAPPAYVPPAVYPPARPPATTSGLDVPLVPRALREPEPPPQPREAPAEVEVRVPAGAELWFGGVKTRQTGAVRLFQSPPVEVGQWYGYDVKARWTEDGKEVERTRHVSVTAGARSAVDFTKRDGE